MKKTMKAAMMVACLTGTGLSAADFSLGSISTGVSEIDNAIGSVDQAISQIAGYDLSGILGDLGADSELMGCLTQNVDLTQIIGGIPTTDGICGVVNTGFSITDILDDPIAKCAGASIEMPEDIKNMQSRFSSFCNGAAGGDNNTGGDDGWGSTTGNTGTSRTGVVYSPVGTTTADVESSSVSGGVSTSEGKKPLADKAYPSGLKVSDLYSGHGGGKLHNALFTNPDGADADAIKNNNTDALILKDLALKLTGSTDETSIHLPEDQLAVLEDENDVANLISLGEVDYYELENELIKKARDTFSSLDANSLTEYYTKEKQAYQNMIQSDADVQKMIATLKETAMRSIGNYYNMKLTQLKKRDDYLPNISYTMERITKQSAKDKFKVEALLQMNEETLIKSDMAIAKRKTNIKIDRTIQQAYYKASIFRADIAKKEIDTILKAVDTAIK